MAVFYCHTVFLFPILLLLTASTIGDDSSARLTTSVNMFLETFIKLYLNKSIVMTPLSAHMSLALLSLGSKGETLKELHTSLYLPDQNFTKASFKNTIESLNFEDKEGVTLSFGNRLHVKEGEAYKLDDQFKTDVAEAFKPHIRRMNAYPLNPRFLSAVLMSQWGEWEKQFDPNETQKQDFFTGFKANPVQVDMMFQVNTFRYADIKDWDAQVLELPYKGGELSMVIILPQDNEGLTDLEKKLSDKDVDIVQKIEASLQEREVAVYVPRFRTDFVPLNLKKFLPELGVPSIATDAVNLSGLLQNNETLYVQEAVQNANIEVSEKGVAAGAISGITVKGDTEEDTLNVFNANKPFYYKIISKKDNLELFTGRFYDN